MAITRYLAMTAAEMRNISQFPEKIAWMACHFSPYSTGISNLPQTLPAGSLLILNDIIPFHGHDPQRIAHQLTDCLEQHNCAGVLLDFQRKSHGHLQPMLEFLHLLLAVYRGLLGFLFLGNGHERKEES